LAEIEKYHEGSGGFAPLATLSPKRKKKRDAAAPNLHAVLAPYLSPMPAAQFVPKLAAKHRANLA
jgi:hypothetical protein